MKNYITNIICSKVDLKINFDEINEDFCRKNNIEDEKNLIKFLALKAMSIEDHKKKFRKLRENKIYSLKRVF